MVYAAAIVGASGYGGGELIRFLDAHPGFEVVALGAHAKAGQQLHAVHPHLSGGDRQLIPFSAEVFGDADVVFLALPHGASAEPAMLLLDRGAKIVDLGSDFRLSSAVDYHEVYGKQHPYPDQLGLWAYGVPELFAESISASDRVAAPGCYPTSAILAIAPVLSAGLVEPSGIVVDSMSGVSGAGRKLSEATSFGSIDESVRAYGVLAHRHQPEMIQALSMVAGAAVDLVFTPHLVPMQRGILSTIYLTTHDGVTADDVATAFDKIYGGSQFVSRVSSPPETRWVVGSNNAMISYHLDVDHRRLIAISAIDNLVKGAAGQAVQCANLMFGFAENTGLPMNGWMP